MFSGLKKALIILAAMFAGLLVVGKCSSVLGTSQHGTAAPQIEVSPTPAPPQLTAERTREWCESVAETAAAVMEVRQAGVPMSEVLKASDSGPNSHTEEFAIKAYEGPRYQTQKHIDREVQDFRNDAFLRCIKGEFKFR